MSERAAARSRRRRQALPDPAVRRTRRAGCCARWMAFRCGWLPARRWASSASPAAASRRWRAWWWACWSRTRAASASAAATSGRRARRAASGAATSRWCSRIPSGSMNPRRTVGASVAEPLWARGVRKTDDEVERMLRLVGLNPKMAARMPHEMSGGQQQRASIARALIAKPALVVHDESVASLDISLQAQILNLLVELQETLGTSYLFISHDLAAVQAISHRVVVMYLGEIVEAATARNFAERPLHPYSVALRNATLMPDPVLERSRAKTVLRGDVPSPMNPPSGCRFRTRCPMAAPVCAEQAPALRDAGGGHLVACHFAPVGAAAADAARLAQLHRGGRLMLRMMAVAAGRDARRAVRGVGAGVRPGFADSRRPDQRHRRPGRRHHAAVRGSAPQPRTRQALAGAVREVAGQRAAGRPGHLAHHRPQRQLGPGAPDPGVGRTGRAVPALLHRAGPAGGHRGGRAREPPARRADPLGVAVRLFGADLRDRHPAAAGGIARGARTCSAWRSPHGRRTRPCMCARWSCRCSPSPSRWPP